MPKNLNKTKFKATQDELGRKGVNVPLDETTRNRLEELIEISGFQKGYPSGKAGVISEAIRRMYMEQAGKKPGKMKTNWLEQNSEIGRNIIKFLLDQNNVEAALEKLKKSKRFPTPSWYGYEEWTKDNLKKLANVAVKVESKKKENKVIIRSKGSKNPFIHEVPTKTK